MAKPVNLNGFPSPRNQIKRIEEKIVSTATGKESIVMTQTRLKKRASLLPEDESPIATKLLKTYTVYTLERQGKQELHPDRSDKTSNKQPLTQKEKLRKKEQELQETEKETEKLKRKKENAQHTLQQQDQTIKTLTARIEERKEEIERLKAEIKKLKEKNEEKRRKKEQDLQEKEKEIEKLKRKEKDVQHTLQQQDQENKTLIKELKEEIERLKAEMKKLKEENEEERRKKEQEIQEKVKEMKKLKRKEKVAQHKLQQKTKENIALTTRIEELEEEIKRLNAKIKKLEEDVEKLKEENEEIKRKLFLAAMCDKLQKNCYRIVFYPHDFSESKQSYKVVNIERDIKYGFYGLTTEEKKRQAKKRWKELMKTLRWKNDLHLSGILLLKYDRNPTAHPEITKDMKESLEELANALNNERKLDEPTFGIVQNLIEMWFKTEDLVQEQE